MNRTLIWSCLICQGFEASSQTQSVRLRWMSKRRLRCLARMRSTLDSSLTNFREPLRIVGRAKRLMTSELSLSS